MASLSMLQVWQTSDLSGADQREDCGTDPDLRGGMGPGPDWGGPEVDRELSSDRSHLPHGKEIRDLLCDSVTGGVSTIPTARRLRKTSRRTETQIPPTSPPLDFHHSRLFHGTHVRSDVRQQDVRRFSCHHIGKLPRIGGSGHVSVLSTHQSPNLGDTPLTVHKPGNLRGGQPGNTHSLRQKLPQSGAELCT